MNNLILLFLFLLIVLGYCFKDNSIISGGDIKDDYASIQESFKLEIKMMIQYLDTLKSQKIESYTDEKKLEAILKSFGTDLNILTFLSLVDQFPKDYQSENLQKMKDQYVTILNQLQILYAKLENHFLIEFSRENPFKVKYVFLDFNIKEAHEKVLEEIKNKESLIDEYEKKINQISANFRTVNQDMSNIGNKLHNLNLFPNKTKFEDRYNNPELYANYSQLSEEQNILISESKKRIEPLNILYTELLTNKKYSY